MASPPMFPPQSAIISSTNDGQFENGNSRNSPKIQMNSLDLKASPEERFSENY
jgi:hypothetical protein